MRARACSQWALVCLKMFIYYYCYYYTSLHVKTHGGPEGLCRIEVCGPAIDPNEPLYTQYTREKIHTCVIYIYILCMCIYLQYTLLKLNSFVHSHYYYYYYHYMVLLVPICNVHNIYTIIIITHVCCSARL